MKLFQDNDPKLNDLFENKINSFALKVYKSNITTKKQHTTENDF